MKIITYIVAALGLLMVTACGQEDIPYYNSADNAVRFSNNSVDGYNNGVLYKNYSFASDPLDEYTIVDLPITLVGNTVDHDRKVDYTVDATNSTAAQGSYEILESVIPADSIKGYIRVKIYNVTKEDATYVLQLILKASDELKLGPSAYLKASLSWNNSIPAPSNRNTIFTYNMMIQGTAIFGSSSLSYYSPNALKTIVTALGWDNWDDQSAHPEYAGAAYARFFAKPGYKYLPDYRLIYADGTYSAYAAQVASYIKKYNETHDTPLLHDAGKLIGQPIEARTY